MRIPLSISRIIIMPRIAVLLLYFGLVTGQTSTRDECEKNVKDYFDRVQNSFVIPSNFSTPSSFDEINDLLNRLKKLISNIADLSVLETNQDDIKNNILDANKTEQLKRGIELLKSIHNRIVFIRASRNRTIHECRTANGKYNMLVNDISAIDKLGSAANKSVAHLFGKIKNSKEKSLQVENEFHSLIIPDFTSAAYLCSTRLSNIIDDLVLTARRIKNILKLQKEEVLSKLKDISGKIGDVEKSRVPKPIFEGGDGTAIKKLQHRVDSLRNGIERYKRMKVPVLEWEGIISKLEERLEKDIRNAEEIKKILLQRNESEQSFRDIGIIVKGLCERGVCNIKEGLDVEQ